MCNQAKEMRLKLHDVELSNRLGDIDFSLYGWEYSPLVEDESKFQYHARTINHTDNYWLEVHLKIGKAQKIWRHLVNLM